LLTCKCAAASPKLIQRSEDVSIYYFSYSLFRLNNLPLDKDIC
jgi:hypothetical protein